MFGNVPMERSMNLLERTQIVFGGVDLNGGAGDGTLFDTMNLSADRYPLLTTRKRRHQAAVVSKPNGLIVRDGPVWVDGTNLVVGGETVAQVSDSRKVMAGLGSRICIWPDKLIYDAASGELSQMEASWTGEAEFSDGTYAGETALANTITAAGDLTELFRAGDAVTVSQMEEGGSANSWGPYVIQETEYNADADKTALRYYEETWREFVAEPESGATDTEGMKIDVTISRTAPDLQIVFEHHNRLWGAAGNTVYACKLGDPTNWHNFEGISTDAWELELGTPGSITGGISYGGRPVFFKERSIIKIYGDDPTSWQTSQTEGLGVEAGSGSSLAAAGGMLLYKSSLGIMAYTGGWPRCVSEEFGSLRFHNACAGSDGTRYYVSMERIGGDWEVWCYDTRHGIWHRENNMAIVAFGYGDHLYGLEDLSGSEAPLWLMGEVRQVECNEEGLVTWAEFNDWTDGTTRKKGVGKLMVRMEVDGGCRITLKIQYDSDGVWHTVRAIDGGMVKGQVEIPVPLRRCDHYRLRIEGDCLGGAGWTLHQLTWTRYQGSNRK